jgi:hypothetical protein
MKFLRKISILAALVPLAACAEEPPVNPVKSELLLASIAAAQDAGGVEAAALAAVPKKAAKADRFTGIVAKADPAKLDPKIAEKLLN